MESKFLDNLIVQELNDKDFQLVSNLHYQSELYNGIIEVPAGFVTDFASVPRVPIAYLLTGDTAHESAVVHDYLYRTTPHICTRKIADGILFEAMEVTNVSWWRRYLIYFGVRIGGSSAWR